MLSQKYQGIQVGIAETINSNQDRFGIAERINTKCCGPYQSLFSSLRWHLENLDGL